MTSAHLLIGSGGEVGRELSRKLSEKGERVYATSHRTDRPDKRDGDGLAPVPLLWDFRTPRSGLSDMDQALGLYSLRSLSIFAHPPFLREQSPLPDLFDSLSSLEALVFLLDHLAPRLKQDSSVIFFFPSLSHHKADSYLSARTWVGAFHGLFDEWSRKHREYIVMGIEILITPDTRTPHLSPEIIRRIADRTSRGRLATADEIADFAAYIARSGNPLFHGQILKTEGGPYY
jgi:NAD(P)-dependent dehydrogenase (short-subunit alcohol dehydrogenase family)